MRRQAVFFDFDDTLHDFQSAYHAALREAVAPVAARAQPPLEPGALAARCREPWEVAWDRTMVERPDPEALWRERLAAVFAAAGVPWDPELACRVHATYLEAMERGIRLFPDALPALERARALGPDTVVGVLTNGPSAVQRRRLERLGLAARLDLVVVSEEVGVSKPAARFFARALEEARVPAERAVLIGDNPDTDVAGARGVGMGSVWLDRAGTGWPAGRAPVPDAVARDLLEAVGRAAELLGRR